MVAIQGEPGAFSHTAVEQLYEERYELYPTRTFDELFLAVVSGKAHRAVVPVENTLAGSVQGNLDRILRHSLHVVAETRARIRLCLVAPPGKTLSDIQAAASHPVALQQCQSFFREHPGVEPVPVYDTAGSIRDLMSGEGAYDAAIGSDLAARIYGGQILAKEIEDDPENYTRFFSVSSTLGVFAERGVDLTKLESRPIPGRPWEYRFFADVRGDAEAELEECLAELGRLAPELTVLGSYTECPGFG